MKFGLDFIRKLKPCKWRYKPPLDDEREHFGFIAQEVLELAPLEDYGFVTIGPDKIHYQLNLGEFIGPLVKASQEMADKIDSLEKQIEQLKQINEDRLKNKRS